MKKTAVGVFQTSETADAVVALLLEAGFSRDQIKLVKRSDFDAQPSPDTDILKLGGVPAEHAGRYWEAVRGGRTLVAVSASEQAERAIEIMDTAGAVYLEEGVAQPVAVAAQSAALSSDPGFYPKRQAAQMFDVV